MATKRFKVEVTRIDEYIIEIDEDIYNEEWITEFERHFHPLDNGLESIAEDIAIFRARFGERFQEGYGRITEDSCINLLVEKDDYAEGLNIVIKIEDEDIEAEVEQLEDLES